MQFCQLDWLTTADKEDVKTFLNALSEELTSETFSRTDDTTGYLKAVAKMIKLYCDHGSLDSIYQFQMDLDYLLKDIKDEFIATKIALAQNQVLKRTEE